MFCQKTKIYTSSIYTILQKTIPHLEKNEIISSSLLHCLICWFTEFNNFS